MWYRQCLHLSIVQVKDKHCQKPHFCNGVVDTFGHRLLFSYCPIKQTNEQKGCFQVPIQYFTFSDQIFSHTMWKDQVERSKSLILMWVSIPEKEWKETYLFWRLQLKITPPESQNIFWFWYLFWIYSISIDVYLVI